MRAWQELQRHEQPIRHQQPKWLLDRHLPSAKPATFHKGIRIVGRTLNATISSLNFFKWSFSWSHIFWKNKIKKTKKQNKTKRGEHYRGLFLYPEDLLWLSTQEAIRKFIMMRTWVIHPLRIHKTKANLSKKKRACKAKEELKLDLRHSQELHCHLPDPHTPQCPGSIFVCKMLTPFRIGRAKSPSWCNFLLDLTQRMGTEGQEQLR